MKTRYKFLNEGLRSAHGDCKWKIGDWKEEPAAILCRSGFHCSKEVGQAFSYVQGEILAEVEVDGDKDVEDDKEVYSKMRIVRAWKWTQKDSVEIAIFAAEQVIDIYEKKYPGDVRPREAIEAAKTWLENPTEKNKNAANAAYAASAAYAAAYAAANAAYAAYAAAYAAANAAYAAASAATNAASAATNATNAANAAYAASAATNAAYAAKKSMMKKIYKRFEDQIAKLESYGE